MGGKIKHNITNNNNNKNHLEKSSSNRDQKELRE